jgi:hypothetical protein
MLKWGVAGMRAESTDADRAGLWRRVEAALPEPAAVLRPALERRLLTAEEDPLRNRLVRKLLMGVDPAKLARQFENAQRLLRNWDEFARDIVQLRGSEFDTRLWPWLAEIRALDFLRAERGAIAARAIPRRRKHKTPDFLVHRENGDGLAEVKLVTPNCNFDTIEEELEIAAIRWPEVFDRRLYILRTPDDRSLMLSQEHEALAAFMEWMRDAVRTGRQRVAHAWRTSDGRGCELVAELRPCERFSLMGEDVGGLLDDDFRQHWLTPFNLRLTEKSHEALMQMREYEAYIGTRFWQKDVVIYYEEPGASAATLLLNDDVNGIKETVSESLRIVDPGTTLSVRC